MPPATPKPTLVGDALARARESWVREMARRLELLGFGDYRRSDALAVRLLRHRPLTLGHFADRMGLSRQAARKVVTGLTARGYARVRVDESDARKRVATLTPRGEAYAEAVIEVARQLDRSLRRELDPRQLDAALSVLAFISDHLGA